MEEKYLILYEKLIRENEAPLVQYASRVVGCDVDTAKDVAQEVFLKAWIHIEKLYIHENPVGWLFKTAYNVSLHEKSRVYRTKEISTQDIDSVGTLDVDLSLEHSLPEGLSKHEREIILLRYEDDWPFEVIAERFGLKPDAVRKQFSRAVTRCRTLIKKEIERENRQEATR